MVAPECPICRLPVGGRHTRRHHDCPFCGRTFSRVDGTKRHIKSCPSRGNRQIPDDAKRGRKRHACDMCTKVKVSCDAKLPCSRCSSKNLSCSYSRFCTDPAHLVRSNQTKKQLSTETDHMKLPFLLACTDPSVGTVDEVILTGEPEQDGESTSHVDNDVPSGTIDPNLLFLGFMDPYFGTEMEFNDATDSFPTPSDLVLDLDEALLQSQVSHLGTQLQQTAAAKQTRNQKGFDPNLWSSFFTTQSFRECINIFFHRDQLLAAIIHKPTFQSDKANPTLLLAIVVSGYSYIHARSMRGFNPSALAVREIAEEYIFYHVEQFLNLAADSSDRRRALELCQAAYIIVTLQSCVKDAKTRRRVITRCHPMLVTLLRNLEMMEMKHDWSGISDWQTFVYRESCIRLVHWTFINDAWLNIFSNFPLAMTLLDMSGDLPCEDALWSIDDPQSFDGTKLEKSSQKNQDICLKLLMSKLLGDDWTPHTAATYQQLDVKHFLVIIFAFQHVLFQSESALLPESGSSVLSRGLKRWTDLWESVLGRVDPEQRETLGLVRYSTELCFLLRRIVELKKSEAAAQLRYLERRVMYDTTAVYELIQYCSK